MHSLFCTVPGIQLSLGDSAWSLCTVRHSQNARSRTVAMRSRMHSISNPAHLLLHSRGCNSGQPFYASSPSVASSHLWQPRKLPPRLFIALSSQCSRCELYSLGLSLLGGPHNCESRASCHRGSLSPCRRNALVVSGTR
jgi:hypothetical protein